MKKKYGVNDVPCPVALCGSKASVADLQLGERLSAAEGEVTEDEVGFGLLLRVE
jgi:hypothetical protein